MTSREREALRAGLSPSAMRRSALVVGTLLNLINQGEPCGQQRSGTPAS